MTHTPPIGDSISDQLRDIAINHNTPKDNFIISRWFPHLKTGNSEAMDYAYEMTSGDIYRGHNHFGSPTTTDEDRRMFFYLLALTLE